MAVWDLKERNDIIRSSGDRGNIALHMDDGSVTIDKINIKTLGNAVDYGDLLDVSAGGSAGGIATRFIHAGGQQSPASSNQIEYGSFVSNSLTTDFGDLTDARQIMGTVNNDIRCVFGGGRETPGDGFNVRNIIDFVTFSTLGDAADFGDLTVSRIGAGGANSPTRGIFAGGNPATNVIDFITIASTGDAADFGDLFEAEDYFGGVSSATRGSFAGGSDSTIQTINIATTGNAVDYGDTSVSRIFGATGDNAVRGVFMGGQTTPGNNASDVIDFIDIAAGGTAIDFGNLQAAAAFKVAGCSNGHGGLKDIQRPSATYMPGSGRGIAMGGYAAPAPIRTVELIHIPSLGNASDFGDTSTAIAFGSANSSLTRTIMQGGYSDDLSTEVDQIQYIEHASKGHGFDFGNLLSTRANSTSTGSCSSTRGLSEGGGTGGGGVVNEIEYITMASVGNGTDFGNLTVARELCASCSNGTRGVTGGGGEPGVSNVMDYVTIASTGNSTDFGNLTVARDRVGSLSSSTRGCFSGGRAPSNSDVIDYITITSAGNATDFGNLSAAKSGPNGMSNRTRGLFLGGRISPANINVIDYITIASTGNAADFGDLSEVKEGVMCGSDSHGGLSS